MMPPQNTMLKQGNEETAVGGGGPGAGRRDKLRRPRGGMGPRGGQRRLHERPGSLVQWPRRGFCKGAAAQPFKKPVVEVKGKIQPRLAQRFLLRPGVDEPLELEIFLAVLVALVLLEVLDEAASQILGLLFPLGSVRIGVAGIQDGGVHAGQHGGNLEVEVGDLLGGKPR